MIKSIKFTGKGKNDYISEHIFKDVVREGVDPEEAERVAERYHRRGPEYDKYFDTIDDGYRNPHLVKRLLNRTFKFSPDKINVIFGPNACGKTTIIRAIAAYAHCGTSSDNDGWTSLTKYTPMSIQGVSTFDIKEEEYASAYYKNIKNSIVRDARNEAVVDWDGVPVYYENMSERRCREFGDMVGGLIESEQEEFIYLFGKQTMSLGQNSIWMLNKLKKIVAQPPTVESLIAANEKQQKGVNCVWQAAAEANLKYYRDKYLKKLPDDANKRLTTVLMDEIDKSMDITNVIALYSEVLPRIAETAKCQMIIVSHSPIILTDNVYNSPHYNVISIDEEYTERCRKLLSNFSFGEEK